MDAVQYPVQIITGRISNPQYGMTIDYPAVVGMMDHTVQKKINDAIMMMVHQLYTDQIKQLVEVQGIWPLPPMEIQGWYEIKTNERGVLSLLIGNYTYVYPAAHGLTLMKALNFDVNTGDVYQLYELFKPDSDYEKVLSDIIRVQIKERDIPLINNFTGIKPVEQDYYIADKVLVLFFQLYELTPYVYGFPQFPITVYEIQDIIREDGLLGRMLH